MLAKVIQPCVHACARREFKVNACGSPKMSAFVSLQRLCLLTSPLSIQAQSSTVQGESGEGSSGQQAREGASRSSDRV